MQTIKVVYVKGVTFINMHNSINFFTIIAKYK